MKICYVGVPPGIGDIYWTLTKLESKRRIEKIDRLILVIYTVNMKITTGVLVRSSGIHNAVDFVDGAVYGEYDHLKPGKQTIKILDGSRIDLDVMWANEHLESGRHLTTWMPQYDTNMDIELKSTPYPGGPILIYPSAVGTNKNWTGADEGWWADLIWRMYVEFDEHPLVIGAAWDMDMWKLIRRRLRAMGHSCCYVDMVGETTLMEAMDVIKNARLLVGVISGMTILANHYKVACVALAPKKFDPQFPYTWIRENTTNYHAIVCDPLPEVSYVVERALNLE